MSSLTRRKKAVGGHRMLPEEVRRLRDAAASGARAEDLARRYAITPKHVQAIVRGRAWPGVDSGTTP